MPTIIKLPLYEELFMAGLINHRATRRKRERILDYLKEKPFTNRNYIKVKKDMVDLMRAEKGNTPLISILQRISHQLVLYEASTIRGAFFDAWCKYKDLVRIINMIAYLSYTNLENLSIHLKMSKDDIVYAFGTTDYVLLNEGGIRAITVSLSVEGCDFYNYCKTHK